jgi:RNA polymerase sigma-70 factor (ECF subfamily)
VACDVLAPTTQREELPVTSLALGAADQLDPRLVEHRRELTGYCYRMLGSAFDAEDAVQETLVRAWRGLGDFEGRSALRSWLYRIATNVCLDQLSGRQRRALPMDLSGSPYPPVESSLAGRRPGTAWVEPILDRQVVAEDADPAEQAVQKESIRLAFVAALQHLPPRQRAVLLLRDVLRWKAEEVAQLLETTVASVNSALQRARATLGGISAAKAARPLDDDDRELLERYVAAFESYDIDAFVQLLHEDATQHMPPFEMWLRGAGDIGAWMLGPGAGCRGSRVFPMRANGQPSVVQYRPGPDGGHVPWAVHVLDVSEGRVSGITSFLDEEGSGLFVRLGLPAALAPGDEFAEAVRS